MKDLRIISVFAVFLAFGFLVGCGGSSSSSTLPPNTITTSGSNVAAISVDGGPVGNYPDAAFTSVTICVPGSSTCQTISGVLVDTGSSGLRILSSALSLALPPQNTSGGDATFECFLFVSGYTWGAVQTADVEVAGEKASSTPIQVIGESTPVPTSCSDQGSSSDTLDTLGANGILGVSMFAQDCGDYCVQADNLAGASAPDVYYDCPSSVCQAIWENLAQQIPNPVTLFAADNNGVIVELPAVSGGEASVSGSLVFGIGTQSNNALSGATIYTADAYGSFTTTYDGQAYSGSFIDSGSNGYFFLDPSSSGAPPTCSDNTGFYCPTATESLSASNQGVNGSSGTVSFSIGNADTLFESVSDNAFGDLGGPATSSAPTYFDWGLPFFFGRNVFVGLQSTTYPNGYWAY